MKVVKHKFKNIKDNPPVVTIVAAVLPIPFVTPPSTTHGNKSLPVTLDDVKDLVEDIKDKGSKVIKSLDKDPGKGGGKHKNKDPGDSFNTLYLVGGVIVLGTGVLYVS